MLRWWMYRLMEKPPGDGGDPGKGGGEPPKKDPPKSGGDKGGDGGDPSGDEPRKAVSLDVLPEALRDRSEAEQKFLLESMVQSLGKRNREVEQLKEKLANLEGRVSATPPKDPEPDPHEGKTITELMLEDSEAALDKYMESRGYVKAFDGLAGRVASTEYEMVKSTIDDFDEYEEDIQAILKEGDLPPTRENVRGAYTMAVGARTLAEKQARHRGTGGSLPPSPPEPPEGGDDDEVKWKSDLEKEIAHAHGVTDPKEWQANSYDKPMELKLPT